MKLDLKYYTVDEKKNVTSADQIRTQMLEDYADFFDLEVWMDIIYNKPGMLSERDLFESIRDLSQKRLQEIPQVKE